MKRILIITASLMVILTSCGKNGNDPEAIRNKIKKYQAQINKLDLKIKELEKQLENDSLGITESGIAILVDVDTIETTVFKHYFEVGGSIEAKEDAFISPEINGQIKAIYVTKGQFVQKGQMLAKLNTEITESSIKEVETNLNLAKVMFEKQSDLWQQKIGSEIQYLQAKSNKESLEARLSTMKAQLAMAEIKAPFSGIVDEIYRKVGELAVPGVQLMKMVNLGELLVKADVSEAYLTSIHLGDTISLEFPSYDNERLTTRVTRMGNIINVNNRTFQVEARIRNVNGKYKPNSVVLMHINDYTDPSALTVPSIIIKQDVQKGFFIFVATPNEEGQLTASKRFVVPGKSYQGKTEILDGLNPEEIIIVEGYNTVSNGSIIRLASR